jgi:hypothetical protein
MEPKLWAASFIGNVSIVSEHALRPINDANSARRSGDMVGCPEVKAGDILTRHDYDDAIIGPQIEGSGQDAHSALSCRLALLVILEH